MQEMGHYGAKWRHCLQRPRRVSNLNTHRQEWIKKKWYIHIPQNITQPLKKQEIPPTPLMNLKGIMLTEIRQRKTNTLRYHLYVESKK